MKELLCLFLMFTSVSVFSQRRPVRPVEPIRGGDDASRELKRLSYSVNRQIQIEANYMLERDKERVIELLGQIEDVINGRGSGNYSRIDLAELLLIPLTTVKNSYYASSGVESGIEKSQDPLFMRIEKSCSSVFGYDAKVTCYKNSLEQARNFSYIDLSKAREVSLAVCSDNASYDGRAVCFEKSIESINHPAINIVAAGCKGISNGYYKSECYEDALKK